MGELDAWELDACPNAASPLRGRLPLQFVNLMALMAAWVYIFDTIQKEREALEMPERDVYAEAEAGQRPGQVSAC